MAESPTASVPQQGAASSRRYDDPMSPPTGFDPVESTIECLNDLDGFPCSNILPGQTQGFISSVRHAHHRHSNSHKEILQKRIRQWERLAFRHLVGGLMISRFVTISA